MMQPETGEEIRFTPAAGSFYQRENTRENTVENHPTINQA
jgi:hypothetical protein